MRSEVQRILEFAQGAEEIKDLDAFHTRLRAVLKPVGVTTLSVNLISKPGGRFSPRILFGERWRRWSEHYVRSALHEHDPAIRMLREQILPFTWDEALARYRTQDAERVMHACRDFTGGGEGFVVPVREMDGALLTAAFAGPVLDLDPETRQALHLAGYYYAVRGREILQGVRLDPDCPLTPRQIECLKWVHAGKTDDEMAGLLGVSHNTVHNHVEAAKRVLNASKRGRAAFEAWRRGWLD